MQKQLGLQKLAILKVQKTTKQILINKRKDHDLFKEEKIKHRAKLP